MLISDFDYLPKMAPSVGWKALHSISKTMVLTYCKIPSHQKDLLLLQDADTLHKALISNRPF